MNSSFYIHRKSSAKKSLVTRKGRLNRLSRVRETYLIYLHWHSKNALLKVIQSVAYDFGGEKIKRRDEGLNKRGGWVNKCDLDRRLIREGGLTLNSRKAQRTNQKYRKLEVSDQQVRRLEETELKKADRTVRVNGQPFRVKLVEKTTF